MRGRILIVDDDRELCAWIEAGLSAHGFITESHTDPTVALAALHDADVDVVVTDLNMRGMNGLALMRAIDWRTSSSRLSKHSAVHCGFIPVSS